MLQQQRICRFCLFEGSNCEDRPLLHLFQNFRYNHIVEKIENCLNIKINSDDKIPPIICQSCLEKVTCFNDFLELTHKSDKQLKLLYGFDGRYSNTSQHTNEVDQSISWLSEEPLKICRSSRTESDFSIGYKAKVSEENAPFMIQRGNSVTNLEVKSMRKEGPLITQPELSQRILCKICNAKVLSKNMGTHLQKHIDKFKSSPSSTTKTLKSGKNPSKKISCKVCQKTFRTENSLAVHMKKMHEIRKIRFSSHKRQRLDKKKLKISLKKRCTPKKFVCKYCKEVFDTVKALHEHLSSHGKTQKVCPKCNKQFLFKKHFDKHIVQCFYAASVSLKKSSSAPIV